jgi:hypothetical protein
MCAFRQVLERGNTCTFAGGATPIWSSRETGRRLAKIGGNSGSSAPTAVGTDGGRSQAGS